ncbi:hypothetical protein K1719_042188 [Acacia pycnantha]|nr:hypothetical protein K1719_042188 [Acacia pycnantha]
MYHGSPLLLTLLGPLTARRSGDLFVQGSQFLNLTERCRYAELLHVDAFCKEGSVTGAEAIVGMMMKCGTKPNHVTYNSLMDGYCLMNNVGESRKLFNKMVNSGLAPDIFSYSILINGLCKIKMVDDAMDLFKEMRCKSLTPHVVTYSSLIDGLCKTGIYCHDQRIL